MTTPDLFSATAPHPEVVTFEPTRKAGLARLNAFASRTGRHYASQRNYDLGPDNRSTVSALSPWIRHRLITEQEVLAHILAHHSQTEAISFIQEVFWRGYFKGWLEQHPSVWRAYQTGLGRAQNCLDRNSHLNADYLSAIEGRTGIACFDHWTRELRAVGYLHNHARMWFASIWIFTLRLPWELGAQFFLDHLLDGDPASNTLSWRWVGGLHTKGKTYLARASNIAKFTQGAFSPEGQLAVCADPLVEEIDHPFVPFTPYVLPELTDYLLLVTSEAGLPEPLCTGPMKGALGLVAPREAHQSARVHRFRRGVVKDRLTRLNEPDDAQTPDAWCQSLMRAAEHAGTRRIITAFAPLGPVSSYLNTAKNTLAEHGFELHQHQEIYDQVTWPHATKGFFKLKKRIPQILAQLKLVGADCT